MVCWQGWTVTGGCWWMDVCGRKGLDGRGKTKLDESSWMDKNRQWWCDGGAAKQPWAPQQWRATMQRMPHCRSQCYKKKKKKKSSHLLDVSSTVTFAPLLLFVCSLLVFDSWRVSHSLLCLCTRFFFSLRKRCLLLVNSGCQSLVYHHLVILIHCRETSGNNLVMLVLFLKKGKVLLQPLKPNPFYSKKSLSTSCLFRLLPPKNNPPCKSIVERKKKTKER